ncbi:efflux RND transporter periplasmic adaptor subunit [Helicobacter sp. CaF467b]|uniref:efflux RND transporter periplasmic adaptor subunit n=1 Tax=Helicobacter sp. CaF467b TaxID=2919923 RepID=UPI001F55F3AC|nr:efflux RND transporter periplasmic adaptor subunit [Helicobacter sp. CaF467b]MCI2236114.1 efflux RND transporter periplasmic adaptor subunit [Helicobacter sp. CaF467b]
MSRILLLLFFPFFLFSQILVTSQPIQSGFLSQNHTYVGSLYFSERALLASEVSGVIEELFVQEGQKITAGQPLAKLNSDLLIKEIKAKESLLKQSTALLKKSKKDFERYKSLYESDSIAYKEYEDALFNLQAQEGNTESIAADLEHLKAQKDKKILKAPYDGVILQRLLKQGEWVSAGASIFNIAKLSPLEANIEVPFSILRSLKIGDLVQVNIANKTYSAKIIALIPLGDAKARTFPIKLSIDDKKGELIEGLEVRANLNITKSQESLLVPRDSILPTQNGDCIFIIKDNKAKQVFIKVNGYEGLNASITPINATLSTKDRVITQGFERLRDNQPIKENNN